MTPAEGVAVAAIVVAALQLLLAGWRDVGAATVGLLGAAGVLALRLDHGDARVRVCAVVVAAMAFAAVAWARGVRNGVGRPAHVGVAMLGATAAIAGSWAVRLADLPTTHAIALGSGTLGLVLGLAALDRPAPRGARPRWYRVVPIEAAKAG